MFRQILNDVTYGTKYRDNGFYAFVCSYDPDNNEVATITQHPVKSIIGMQLHELRYHMNFGERYNSVLGHKLARDEVFLFFYTHTRTHTHTHTHTNTLRL